jgi:hypothetical protein
MKRALLFVVIGAVLSGGPRPARADPTRGPFQVMRPDGTVVRVSSEAAGVWWTEYHAGRCVTCRSPQQAAELLDEVESALGGRFHGGPRYLILVESLRSHWPRAWVFYPSSDETPAYVMHPGGVGSGAAPLRWDAWQPATPRMEEIVLEATKANPPPTVAVGSDQTGADGTARARGIVIAVVVLAAVIAGLGAPRRGGWLRHWDPPARGDGNNITKSRRA